VWIKKFVYMQKPLVKGNPWSRSLFFSWSFNKIVHWFSFVSIDLPIRFIGFMTKPRQCSRITLFFYGRRYFIADKKWRTNLKYPPKQITKTRTELKWLMNESNPGNMINDQHMSGRKKLCGAHWNHCGANF
jgi:hypothetical protein